MVASNSSRAHQEKAIILHFAKGLAEWLAGWEAPCREMWLEEFSWGLWRTRLRLWMQEPAPFTVSMSWLESMMRFARERQRGLGMEEELTLGKLWGFPQVETWVSKETLPQDNVANLPGYTWHMQPDVFTASLERAASDCSWCPSAAGAGVSGRFPELCSGKLSSLTPLWESCWDGGGGVPPSSVPGGFTRRGNKQTVLPERREHGNHFQSVFASATLGKK